MVRVLIENVDIVTLDPHGTVLRDSCLAVEGEMIVGVGQVPPGFVPDERFDGHYHLAMPALFNAHCHAAMTYERGGRRTCPSRAGLTRRSGWPNPPCATRTCTGAPRWPPAR